MLNLDMLIIMTLEFSIDIFSVKELQSKHTNVPVCHGNILWLLFQPI